MKNHSNFAIIPTEIDGNRLDIENIFSISVMFYQNITVLEWKKWGSRNEPFSPFESLFHVNSAYSWKNEHFPKGPIDVPNGYDFDIRWMPKYFISDSVAFMQWEENYATTWFPAMVGVDKEHHKLLIWDIEKAIWAEFTIRSAPNSKAFYRFIHAWIDW